MQYLRGYDVVTEPNRITFRPASSSSPRTTSHAEKTLGLYDQDAQARRSDRAAAAAETPMSAPSRLTMTGIRKAFGPTAALRGVDLELRPGEVHALVGENGAGKSTLMKVLSGAVAADAGTMTLDGEPFAPRGPARRPPPRRRHDLPGTDAGPAPDRRGQRHARPGAVAVRLPPRRRIAAKGPRGARPFWSIRRFDPTARSKV